MPDEGLKVIMDQRVVGTLTLLSQFFDPSDSDSTPSPSTKTSGEIKEGEVEKEGKERVKMNILNHAMIRFKSSY